MAITYRILACTIPVKLAALAAFTWYATRPPNPAPTQFADHIVVVKSSHTMTLFANGKPIHIYQIALGRSTGRKLQQGDHRTPEGHYLIDSRNPHSGYHLALHISYPNPDDRARAASAHAPAGGDVMVHGLPPQYAWLGYLHRETDWTDGCIAVTNAEIEEIYKLVPNNTPIDIQP